MNNPQAKLNEYIDFIQKENGISDAGVLKTLSLTRHLIEKRKEQDKYIILNFYCNWSAHNSLSGSNTCYKMLARITDVFLSDDGINKVNIPMEVSRILSIVELRNQFIELYTLTNIPTFLFDYFENWSGFVKFVINEIIDKPIEFPKKMKPKVTIIFDDLEKKTIKRPVSMAKKLWLEKVVGKTLKGKDGEIFWFVETAQNVRVCGPLVVKHSKSDFIPKELG